ncbi:hypothetical protein IEQ34_018803 [Dendrobium chrysotoxum]|uniref:Uncharacterized protein n=1 Tax=Dendrobium chrysotoxum TaxID=161865 RepID=A0AAV7G748_DENCH|nr:hypothetical protein IEQ34_018803 [Dendrobium chrysotoxum]
MRPCISPDHHLRPCNSSDHHPRPCTSPDHHLKPCSSPDHRLRPCSSLDHHLRPCSSLDHHLRPCNPPDYHLGPEVLPDHLKTPKFRQHDIRLLWTPDFNPIVDICNLIALGGESAHFPESGMPGICLFSTGWPKPCQRRDFRTVPGRSHSEDGGFLEGDPSTPIDI